MPGKELERARALKNLIEEKYGPNIFPHWRRQGLGAEYGTVAAVEEAALKSLSRDQIAPLEAQVNERFEQEHLEFSLDYAQAIDDVAVPRLVEAAVAARILRVFTDVDEVLRVETYRGGYEVNPRDGTVLVSGTRKDGVWQPLDEYIKAEYPEEWLELAQMPDDEYGRPIIEATAAEQFSVEEELAATQLDPFAEKKKLYGDFDQDYEVRDPDYNRLLHYAQFIGVNPDDLVFGFRGRSPHDLWNQSGTTRDMLDLAKNTDQQGALWNKVTGEMVAFVDNDGSILSIIPKQAELTPIEAELNAAFQRAGLTPDTQWIVENFRTDFAFPELKIIIEADGRAYHDDPDELASDEERQRILEDAGWLVFRYFGDQIMADSDAIVAQVRAAMEGRQRVEVDRSQPRFQTGKTFAERMRKARWGPSDAAAELAKMSDEQIAMLQADLLRAGVLSPTQFRLGVADEATKDGLGVIMWHANEKGWVDDGEWRRSLEVYIDTPVPHSVTPSTLAGPFRTPDYDSMALSIESQFRSILGRDPSQNELDRFARRMSRDYRERWMAEQKALAEAENAGLTRERALEIIDNNGVQRGRELIMAEIAGDQEMQSVNLTEAIPEINPEARLVRELERRYAAEIQGQETRRGDRVNFNNMQSLFTSTDARF